MRKKIEDLWKQIKNQSSIIKEINKLEKQVAE